MRFAVTERVERVVVLNKLDFEWRTETEKSQIHFPKTEENSEAFKNRVSPLAQSRPLRVTGLDISTRKLAKTEWFSEVASQKKIL